MGVRGLESFLEKHANIHQACYDIDIKQIVENYKAEHKLPPVIIISASSANRFLYRNYVKFWIHGGQLKHYAQVLTTIISQLQNFGVKVVVVFHGITLSSMRHGNWISRFEHTPNSVVEAFKNIISGLSPNEEESKTFLRPNNLNSVTYYVAKNMGCEVLCSKTNTVSFIAYYARKHSCLGILAQNSDYVIHECSKYYLSIKHLDINRMVTKNYDRLKLIEHLGIIPSHLPLLASLSGNCIIHIEDLQDFHWRINRRSYYRNPIFISVANFIKSNPYLKNPRFDINEENVRKIAAEVFIGNEEMLNLFVQSVFSYREEAQENDNLELLPITDDANWNAILRAVMHLINNNPVSLDNAYVILNQTLSHKTIVADYLNILDCPSFEIIKPLFEKLIGFLLFERPEESKVLVRYKEVSPNFIEEYTVKPVYPAIIEHPGLLVLWSGDVEMKWSMIGNIFNESISRVRLLPPQLVVPGLAFRFLKNKLKIQDHEMNALISSACLLSDYDSEFLETIDRPVATKRSLSLYSVVTTTFRIIILVFDGIGNPIPLEEITPLNYQDGLLFNLKYSQASCGCEISELCDNKEIAVERFNQLNSFILHQND